MEGAAQDAAPEGADVERSEEEAPCETKAEEETVTTEGILRAVGEVNAEETAPEVGGAKAEETASAGSELKAEETAQAEFQAKAEEPAPSEGEVKAEETAPAEGEAEAGESTAIEVDVTADESAAAEEAKAEEASLAKGKAKNEDTAAIEGELKSEETAPAECEVKAEETGPAEGEARAGDTGPAEDGAKAEGPGPAEGEAKAEKTEADAQGAAEIAFGGQAGKDAEALVVPTAGDEQEKTGRTPRDRALKIHLRDDKLLTSYQVRCKEVSRRPNALVHRSIVESAAADDGTLEIEAPGNAPHTFCSRLDDVDMTLINRTFSHVAKYLVRVDLSYNKITSDGIPALVELLKGASELTSLCLKGNDIDAVGMSALLGDGNVKHLRRLDVSQNPLEKNGGLAVAEYLQNNRVLQEVWMDDCGIDCDVLIAISAVLHVNNQTLKVCSLQNPRLVNLQGEHCYHFSRMLRVNCGIQELFLGKHRIRDRDIEIMVSYLMENMSLKVLDLRCNEIGTAGAIALSKWLATPKCQLQKLNLCANRIGEKGSTSGVEALADSLLPNRMLCYLNLNDNRLCPDALRLLGQAIDQRESKQMRLELFRNDWNDEAARTFYTVFTDTSRIFPVEADFCLREVDDRISVAQA